MSLAARRRAKKLAMEALARNEPSSWFERLYAEAGGDPAGIPWAKSVPNPHLGDWLAAQPQAGAPAAESNRRALVVGCGLGDDAVELAQRGWQVTAFDISATAIGWCRQRFATGAGAIEFVVADLFAPPADWRHRFGLVFESYTLQALPETVRAVAAERVSDFVAPGGRLLLLCRGRDPQEDPGSVPWPLTRAEIDPLPGLRTVRFEEFMDDEDPPQRRFRIEYTRVR